MPRDFNYACQFATGEAEWKGMVIAGDGGMRPQGCAGWTVMDLAVCEVFQNAQSFSNAEVLVQDEGNMRP